MDILIIKGDDTEMPVFLSRKSQLNAMYVIGWMVVGCLSCITLPARPWAQNSQAPGGSRIDPVMQRLVEAHNQLRTQEGLAALKINTRLMDAAQVHAQDMAQHETLSHQGSDGTMPAQRVKRQGYTYQKTAENIAMGQATPEAVMQGWLHSPPHRQNIFSDFTEIGAARVASDNGVPYWCVVFGAP